MHSIVRFIVCAVLFVAAACGDPRSDAVFVKTLPGRGGGPVDSTTVAASARPRLEITAFSGMYRREGTDSRFQPCGTREPLPVIGTGEGRALLAERFRWNSMWQGQALFAILRGAIVTDTVPGEGADSLKTTLVRRFFVTGVDSMRIWEADCNGMRAR